MLLAALYARPAAATRPMQPFIAYRADAVILILGLPIFSRAGVGSGYAEARSETAEDGARHFLRFVGASLPERAHGLDRAGYIEESVQQRNSSLISAQYFGLMTSSTEETAEQARRALAAHGKDLSFSAIQGASLPGFRECASASFGYPRGTGGRDWRDLVATARHNLESVPKKCSGNPADSSAASPTLPTFLYAVRRAIESREPRLKQTFVYGDRQWWLDTEKAADPHMSRELAASGPVFKIAGAVRKHEQDSPAVFRMWCEAGNPLPLRIDYQPRSFLRLSFVRDTVAQVADLPVPAGGRPY
jgi:hypothetical protein